MIFVSAMFELYIVRTNNVNKLYFLNILKTCFDNIFNVKVFAYTYSQLRAVASLIIGGGGGGG